MRIIDDLESQLKPLTISFTVEELKVIKTIMASVFGSFDGPGRVAHDLYGLLSLSGYDETYYHYTTGEIVFDDVPF